MIKIEAIVALLDMIVCVGDDSMGRARYVVKF